VISGSRSRALGRDPQPVADLRRPASDILGRGRRQGQRLGWWIAPERALREPEITLVYATRKVLESVAGDDDVNRLFARARRITNIPIVELEWCRRNSGWEIVH